MTTFSRLAPVALFLAGTSLSGCAEPEPAEPAEERVDVATAELFGIGPDCDVDSYNSRFKQALCKLVRRIEGHRLFRFETFDGNGRTCQTCHLTSSGTINPQQVRWLKTYDPDNPLFTWDGLDNFTSGTSRIEEAATILIERDLPANVTLTNDPAATSVVVERGIISNINSSAFDVSFMWDFRDLDLQSQALGAVNAHAQPNEQPSDLDLELLEEFQQNARRFFSSRELRNFAKGGPEPGLPAGNTAAQQRGREFFVDTPWNPPSTKGVCALCHSGPLLNESNFASTDAIGNPPGFPVFNTQVNLANRRNLPTESYQVSDDCGNVVEVTTTDLGVLYTDPFAQPEIAKFLPPPFICAIHPSFFAGMFKTPTLRGIKKTAPYFHDNSAATLRESVEHYNFLFDTDPSPLGQAGLQLSEGDIDDIVAYMRIL